MSHKTLEMIGVFWKGHQSYRAMHSFSGDIVVSDDGSFFGVLTDQYGTSHVRGRFKKGMLEFDKQLACSDASRGKSHYLLRAGILMQGDPIVGGWKGIYEVPPCECKDLQKCNHLIGEDRYGEAALSIFVV